MVEALVIDYGRILADLKAADPEAIRRAYRDTFSGDFGRFVLIHFLNECGVGEPRGREAAGDSRAYEDGRTDAALRLMELAGYGQQAAAVVVVANTLEGQDDRYDSGPAGRYDDGGDGLDLE